MQFQALPTAGSHYQNRFVVQSPHNNQRYYSPLPPNIISNQTPFTRNQQKANSRFLSPQINSNHIPQIINNRNNFNNEREVNLNINSNNHNNGAFNPAYYPNNNFPISQNLGIMGSLQMLGPQFVNMGEEYFYNTPRFEYPPSASFLGLQKNLGPPQPYIPIKPPTKNQINQQIKFNAQQDKVHCVVCQNDYYLSDHKQHIKIHKRSKQNPVNRRIKKFANQFKKQLQQPKTRPIVEPEEYNIQYNPNSFVLQKETSFSTPTIVRPTFNNCSVGTSEIDINTKSNLPAVIPILKLQPMKLIDNSITSITSGFPIDQHSVRFSRDTFISDRPSQLTKTFPMTTQRQTIRQQSVNIIPAQINLSPPAPVYEKVQLSQDHYQNLDKLDPYGYKNSAKYQRKYIPFNGTILNSHAHQNLINPSFVQNLFPNQAQSNNSQQKNQIINQFSQINPNQVEISKKSIRSQVPIINQEKQHSEFSYSYSQPSQNIQEPTNNFHGLSDANNSMINPLSVHTSKKPAQKNLNSQQPQYFKQQRNVQDSKSSNLPQEPIFEQTIQINHNQQSKYNALSSDRSMTFSQSYSILQQNTPNFHKKKRLPKSFGGLNP